MRNPPYIMMSCLCSYFYFIYKAERITWFQTSVIFFQSNFENETKGKDAVGQCVHAHKADTSATIPIFDVINALAIIHDNT